MRVALYLFLEGIGHPESGSSFSLSFTNPITQKVKLTTIRLFYLYLVKIILLC